jgi:hypothetical protein
MPDFSRAHIMIGRIKRWYLTRGDSHTAWDRCLPIWRRDGGINDMRRIGGIPTFYSPSHGYKLARVFAKRHSNDVALFLNETQNADAVTALCAIDLLCEIACVAPKTIPLVTASELRLTEFLRKTLVSDVVACKPFNEPTPDFDTVGAYFRWQFSPEDE